jgi:hypothetical protein
MLATSNHVKRKKDDKNSLNFALIAEVEEISSVVDVDEIVARNNITNLLHWRSYTILPYLRIW